METNYSNKAHHMIDLQYSFQPEKYRSRPEKYLSLKEKGLIEEYEWFEEFKINEDYED